MRGSSSRTARTTTEWLNVYFECVQPFGVSDVILPFFTFNSFGVVLIALSLTSTGSTCGYSYSIPAGLVAVFWDGERSKQKQKKHPKLKLSQGCQVRSHPSLSEGKGRGWVKAKTKKRTPQTQTESGVPGQESLFPICREGMGHILIRSNDK